MNKTNWPSGLWSDAGCSKQLAERSTSQRVSRAKTPSTPTEHTHDNLRRQQHSQNVAHSSCDDVCSAEAMVSTDLVPSSAVAIPLTTLRRCFTAVQQSRALHFSTASGGQKPQQQPLPLHAFRSDTQRAGRCQHRPANGKPLSAIGPTRGGPWEPGLCHRAAVALLCAPVGVACHQCRRRPPSSRGLGR